jgi:hypothetical protein
LGGSTSKPRCRRRGDCPIAGDIARGALTSCGFAARP